ncbi:MAG: hypothetical protein PHH77_04040 [Victivallaceae bacterium]|nr:hypothetical protein [Victivallaceae bacterium]
MTRFDKNQRLNSKPRAKIKFSSENNLLLRVIALIMISGLQAGGQQTPPPETGNNLIKNPGFENGLPPWNIPSRYCREGKVFISGQNPHSGQKCLQLRGDSLKAFLSIYYH